VPLARFLVGELAVHVTGKSPDELLFTGGRGVVRSQTFQRAAFTRTAEALKIPGFHRNCAIRPRAWPSRPGRM